MSRSRLSTYGRLVSPGSIYQGPRRYAAPRLAAVTGGRRVRRRRRVATTAMRTPRSSYARRRTGRRARSGLSAVELQNLQRVYGGNFFRKLWSGVKSVGRFAKRNKLLSRGLALVPHPTAQKAATIARTVGLGRPRGGRGSSIARTPGVRRVGSHVLVY